MSKSFLHPRLLITEVFVSSVPVQNNPELCLSIPPKHCGTILSPSIDLTGFKEANKRQHAFKSTWTGVLLQVSSEHHQYITINVYAPKMEESQVPLDYELSMNRGPLLGSTSTFMSDLIRPSSHHFFPLRHPHSLPSDDQLKLEGAALFIVALGA
jgi:hypothetical protein